MTIVVIVLALVVGAVVLWWKLLRADSEGTYPINHFSELTREDGGLGPIQKRDQQPK